MGMGLVVGESLLLSCFGTRHERKLLMMSCRMCAGSHLANRELYTCFLRLILAFNITEAKDQADRPILDCLECNNIPTSLTMDPKPFKLNFKCRGGKEGRSKLEGWLRGSEESTKEL